MSVEFRVKMWVWSRTHDDREYFVIVDRSTCFCVFRPSKLSRFSQELLRDPHCKWMCVFVGSCPEIESGIEKDKEAMQSQFELSTLVDINRILL